MRKDFLNMLTWILKNNYLFTVIAGIVFLIEIKTLISYFKRIKQYPKPGILQAMDMVGKTFALLSIVLICGILDSCIRNEYIHDSDWTTIYTQNEKNCISLNLKSYGTYPGEFTTSTCSQLDEDYVKFKQLIKDSNPHGSIAFEENTTNLETKNQNSTRTINLDSKNIIIEGELNQNSRITKIEYTPTSKMKRTLFGFASESFITKIEYRPVTQMYNTLFGFEGEYEQPNIDGEIRITVNQDDTHTELKNLFGD